MTDEDHCPVCGPWPRAERQRRRKSDDYFQMSRKGTCAFCRAAFFEAIRVWVKDEEEMDALTEAIREDRRKGNPRPNGHELLKEIRARKATRH